MKYSKLVFGLFLTIFLHVTIFYSGFIESFDYKTYDYMSKITDSTSKESKSSVVIVDIDEKSLRNFGQWPWSRIILAQLTKKINEARPTSIGFDIIFPEFDKTSPKEMISFYDRYFSKKVIIDGLEDKLLDNDKIFANALRNSKSILSVYMTNEIQNEDKCVIPLKYKDIIYNSSDYMESKFMLCNISILQKSASAMGFVNSQRDSDGVFRRTPLLIKYQDSFIPSLGLASLINVDKMSIENEKASILGHSFDLGKDSNVLLKFYENKKYKVVSAYDLLSGQISREILQGKFVLIGTSAVGLHDRYMISFSRVIPGVFAHATLIDNILNDELKSQPEDYKKINLIISLLLSLLIVYSLFREQYIRLLSIFLISSISFAIVGIYFLTNNIYISLGYFLVPFVFHFFIINLINIFLHYKERKKFYEDLTKAHSSTIDSMALVAETKDTDTGAHIQRTKEYVALLANYLYKEDIYKDLLSKHFIDLMYRAAPLHDIGKVGIPDSILKKPGKLSDEEFNIMKTHSKIGKNIIENAMKGNEQNEFLKVSYNICYYHHEKWDGSGYPCALKGEDIPLEARMMALCDVYDALISRRCYKQAFEYKDSEDIIINSSGSHFDPTLVEAFITLKDQFKEIAQRIK